MRFLQEKPKSKGNVVLFYVKCKKLKATYKKLYLIIYTQLPTKELHQETQFWGQLRISSKFSISFLLNPSGLNKLNFCIWTYVKVDTLCLYRLYFLYLSVCNYYFSLDASAVMIYRNIFQHTINHQEQYQLVLVVLNTKNWLNWLKHNLIN